MTITFALPPETERKLREVAAQAGQTVEGFVRQLVEREVLGANGSPGTEPLDRQPAVPRTGRTFDEILAPIREGFAESGLTDEELDRLLEEAREEVWRERQELKDQP